MLSLPHARVLLLASSRCRREFSGVAATIARYGAAHPNGLESYTVDYLSVVR